MCYSLFRADYNSGDMLKQSCLQSLTIQEEEILGGACYEIRRNVELAPLFAPNPLRDCCMVSKRTPKLKLDFQNLVRISCRWTILIDDIFVLKEMALLTPCLRNIVIRLDSPNSRTCRFRLARETTTLQL
jgi:hypothetical protein